MRRERVYPSLFILVARVHSAAMDKEWMIHEGEMIGFTSSFHNISTDMVAAGWGEIAWLGLITLGYLM